MSGYHIQNDILSDTMRCVNKIVPADKNSDEKFAAHQRMAMAIIETVKEKGGCLPQDLLEKGFTPEETVDQWHMAQAMADVELRLMST